ncbi:MAG: 4-(cytidine 5'-diphospho)-2-C-methyl-D-erythritol kinase [Pseudomonadota bacterium]|nr:4-(cytidine 5'-diphospho)-2-C-methyl-D-erythritol kinase [Pseudomonadota bacterium]
MTQDRKRANAVREAPLYELASAKVNLILKVLGRRPDGYHELRSLVVFPAIGDWLQLMPGHELSLGVFGAFGASLEGEEDNLVLRAARLFRSRVPDALVGRFQLQKNLPVASGIGGGSADAAAALRLLTRVNPDAIDLADLKSIALELGSDVPACLTSRASVMSGRGERLDPIESLPPAYVLLVNPGVALSSRDVFSKLDAAPLAEARTVTGRLPTFETLERLAEHVRSQGNDLLDAACEVAPVIASVMAAISVQSGCLAASMSGSGATCFGLFADADAAHEAATSIAQSQPGWWAVHAELS